MIKRTIYVSQPSYLKLKNHQMVVEEPETQAIKGSIPIEDIALLLLDHYQITLSQQLLIMLQTHKVAVVSCDDRHMPLGLMLPLYGHSEHAERVKHQLQATEPLKKQLWKQTIMQKIKNQQALLKQHQKPQEPMSRYLTQVKTGDTTNMEGIAAQHYWKHLFANFTRERFGEAPNHLLNFGYAVLRSIIARALVGSGLLPVLGIFHKNKYNPYALADDVMEPYRPFVDALVIAYRQQHPNQDELTKEARVHLLTLVTQDVCIDKQIRPLMIAATATTASLYKCLVGEYRTLRYPEFSFN